MNNIISDEQRAQFGTNNMLDPPVLSPRTVPTFIRYQNYPNDNRNRHVIIVTEYMQEYFTTIEQHVQADEAEIQEQKQADQDADEALAEAE